MPFFLGILNVWKIFGHCWRRKTEKEKKEIWVVREGEGKLRRKRTKIVGKEKYILCGGEEKQRGQKNFGEGFFCGQGCIFCLTCSYLELTKDHVLTSAYVKIFRNVTRNAVNKSV